MGVAVRRTRSAEGRLGNEADLQGPLLGVRVDGPRGQKPIATFELNRRSYAC